MISTATDTKTLFAFIRQNGVLIEKTMRSDFEETLRDNDPLLMEVLAYALLSGGKRLRPVLTMISSRICGRNDEQLFLLAAAFEYLHGATLIHDDVIDHADKRRGRMSVVERYGMTAAILAGDWLHARSMNLISSLVGRQGLDVFCAATADMVDGEFLQMRYVADPTVSEEQYFAVVIKKTARLISSACEIGALYGGGSSAQAAALADYGSRLGTAFQIVDDLLDYMGDERTTGKKIGNDFAEGKMTLPLIHALSQGNEDERQQLLAALQGERSQDEVYETARQLMDKMQGFSYSRRRAEQELEQGLAALSCFDAGRHPESLGILYGLADYILKRDC